MELWTLNTINMMHVLISDGEVFLFQLNTPPPPPPLFQSSTRL